MTAVPGLAALRRPSAAGSAGIVIPLLVSTLGDRSAISLASVGVAMAIAALVGPAAAVGATAALLPIVFVTTRVGSTEWSVLELSLVCTAAASGVELLRGTVSSRDGRHLRALLRPVDLTVVALVIALIGVASLEWVADSRASDSSFRELRRVILEPLVVVVAIRLSPLEATRSLVGRCLAVAGVAVSIIALAQVGLRTSTVDVGSVFRPIGTYPHPNNLALYLERVVWLPIAVVGASPRWSRVGRAGSALVGLACAATLSRGAVIALVLGAVVWAGLGRRRVSRPVIAVAAAAAAALVLLGRLGGDGTESLGSRRRIWSAALEMLRDHPVTGVGIDQFYQLYGTRYVSPAGWSERYTSHPHDIVLDFWLQLGVGGLLVLGAILWLVARRLRAARASVPEPVVIALLAGLVGSLGHGLIDNGFFLPDLATFLWLTLALTAVPATPRAARWT